jgi:hypothetical protein
VPFDGKSTKRWCTKGFIVPTKTVGEIANIRAGTAFRERISHRPGGRLLVAQGKDITEDGALIFDGMIRVDQVSGARPDLLRTDEVLLQTRGMSYRAAVVPPWNEPVIAAGALFILTPDTARIRPDYLAGFLNLPATQQALRQLATGTSILNLRRSAVESLVIPVPPLPDQARFVELARLVRRSAELQERLTALRLNQLHALLGKKKAGGAHTPPAPSRSDRRANAARPSS